MGDHHRTGRIAKAMRLYHTVKYLNPRQIRYRLWYALRRKVRKLTRFSYPLEIPARGIPLVWENGIDAYPCYENGTFTFLNLSKTFEERIDWNFSGYGKLWTYNLNYFDFLNQPGMTKEEGLKLIEDYMESMRGLKDGLEPFPIALRGINWIKFLGSHAIRDDKIDANLRAQYAILMDNLEYHLLGNHLLENGFSLLFGACYFKDDTLYAKAREILEAELEEQILEDGAHFELSPMYHQIMLYRVLDCINLLQNNPFRNDGLSELLGDKAGRMLGWLKNISYRDGSIPLLNDSAEKIAPTGPELFDYASRLGIETEKLPLGESGYRIKKTDRYELVMDVGKIGPDYIPGHAHADTFSFELRVDGKPLIVDTGTSTYETNERRRIERGTAAHNTVEVEHTDQSEVWGGFRVARRANVHDLVESDDSIKAWHDGYLERFGAKHYRQFECDDNKIIIADRVESTKPLECAARLHFHPEVDVTIEKNMIQCGTIIIQADNASIEIADYEYAPQFNRRMRAKVALLHFEKSMKVEIVL